MRFTACAHARAVLGSDATHQRQQHSELHQKQAMHLLANALHDDVPPLQGTRGVGSPKLLELFTHFCTIVPCVSGVLPGADAQAHEPSVTRTPALASWLMRTWFAWMMTSSSSRCPCLIRCHRCITVPVTSTSSPAYKRAVPSVQPRRARRTAQRKACSNLAAINEIIVKHDHNRPGYGPHCQRLHLLLDLHLLVVGAHARLFYVAERRRLARLPAPA